MPNSQHLALLNIGKINKAVTLALFSGEKKKNQVGAEQSTLVGLACKLQG